MYKTHWGIKGQPFQPRHNSPFIHQTPENEETQARLAFLLTGGCRVGLLLGERGAGKSLQIERCAEQSCRRGHLVASLQLGGVDEETLLFDLAPQWGLRPAAAPSSPRFWQAIADRLIACQLENRRAVLLLDDVDHAGQGVNKAIHRLLHLAAADHVLTLVMAAHPETLHRIGPRLLERVDLRIDVVRWSLEDTEQHLRHALRNAGRDQPVFEREAIVRLHQLGHGVPRFINRLADLALVAGAGRNADQINSEVVESVFHELGSFDT